MLYNNLIKKEDWPFFDSLDGELNNKYQNNNSVDERYFLICDCCYWCTSYLPDFVNEIKAHFDSCPMCNQKIKSMHISEKVLDSKHIQNIMTESENWIN